VIKLTLLPAVICIFSVKLCRLANICGSKRGSFVISHTFLILPDCDLFLLFTERSKSEPGMHYEFSYCIYEKSIFALGFDLLALSISAFLLPSHFIDNF